MFKLDLIEMIQICPHCAQNNVLISPVSFFFNVLSVLYFFQSMFMGVSSLVVPKYARVVNVSL